MLRLMLIYSVSMAYQFVHSVRMTGKVLRLGMFIGRDKTHFLIKSVRDAKPLPPQIRVWGEPNQSSPPPLGLDKIFEPKKIAFKNSLFVPYQNALKLGLSTKAITFPPPYAVATTAGEFFNNF
jgi:hypothetical protein